MTQVWSAEAPSNIALIKYMGKVNFKNVPTNPSLSYTLNDLRSRVEIKETDALEDSWTALIKEGWQKVELSEQGQNRFLDHWSFLKKEFDIIGNYIICSANNFASDCGLASSASSFAALTLCAHQVALDKGNKDKADMDVKALAALSRQGSGSSCRSLFSPWAFWQGEDARPFENPYTQLQHMAVMVDSHKKEVRSSEAHQRVKTSLLFEGRFERATKRCEDLMQALKAENWKQAFEITWQEFWDMHALFETSSPSFGYMTGKSVDVLNKVKNYWEKNQDGPLVTMDAGPNIHLLFHNDQTQIVKDIKNELSGYDIR